MKRQEICEGRYFYTSAPWSCELDDYKRVPIGLHLEVINMYDSGCVEEDAAPWYFSINICAVMPHESFDETEYKHAGPLTLVDDCMNYMGGVPVDDKLLSLDALNERIIDDLKARDAVIHTRKQDYGTVAAREGKNYTFTYPSFTNEEACLAFADAIIREYGGVLMTLVGFTLDRPINMVGDTGWSVIEKQVNGVSYRKAMS